MCVFLRRETIYENNSCGYLLEQLNWAHWAWTFLYHQAISNKMWIPYTRFNDRLSCMFHNTIHHYIKDTFDFYMWKCICMFVRRNLTFWNAYSSVYFRRKYKCQRQAIFYIIRYFNSINMLNFLHDSWVWSI